jgi:triacylglycerol lipase
MNIVLVHGILGFDRIGPVGYFNGIADYLHQRFGASVYAPALDPTAGTDKRSAMLRQSIQDAFTRQVLDPTQPIHIIAHSMGGLDARRLISENPRIEVGASQIPVKALATIGTPHRGSPIADVVALQYVPKLPLIAPVLAAAKAALGDVLQHFRISLNGLHDLTTASARDFNSQFPDRLGVTYSSCAGVGRPGLVPTSGFFLPYRAFIRICEGESSDGEVPLSSAQWTGFDPDLWPADPCRRNRPRSRQAFSTTEPSNP